MGGELWPMDDVKYNHKGGSANPQMWGRTFSRKAFFTILTQPGPYTFNASRYGGHTEPRVSWKVAEGSYTGFSHFTPHSQGLTSRGQKFRRQSCKSGGDKRALLGEGHNCENKFNGRKRSTNLHRVPKQKAVGETERKENTRLIHLTQFPSQCGIRGTAYAVSLKQLFTWNRTGGRPFRTPEGEG